MATRRKVIVAENGSPTLLLGNASDPAFATAAPCPLFGVVVALQYAATVHQFNHWFAEGPAFMSLHDLFGSAYALCNGDADSVAERAVVHGEPLSVRSRLQAIMCLEDKFASSGRYDASLSLAAEECIIDAAEAAIKIYEVDGVSSGMQGTINLLQGICDSHDQLIYKLTRITANESY